MITLTRDANSTRPYILILTLIVACLGAQFARADNATDDVPKIVVSLAGIEMSTPKGAELAYGRIRSAAKIVCRVGQSREPQQIGRARACFQNAVADGVGQANRPELTALYARRMGDRAQIVQTARR